MARLELRVTADVDDVEVEAELLPDAADDLERPLAETAALRVVDGDAARAGYG